ncbi:MAG: acetylornithine deacetylase/succinyl-diaminopimelate desuccinylase family protein [Pseudomonadota bacterium]|nr:acetylornithine deacetylase/succinyl-diaminopimelate desuccinylase family protein [Pseudomonadota bacterium]
MVREFDRESLMKSIEDDKENLKELTSKLIQIPTENPPGENYYDICNFLEKRFKNINFSTKLIRAKGEIGDSDKYPRWNFIARREGECSGECIHFNSHIDVVEAGTGWKYNPFGGEVLDGKIYGRGACDMKGGLASSIIAIENFIRIHPNYKGAIEISGTADEESGGFSGVAYLAKNGYFNPEKVHHVIIPEPLNKNRICLGHRGVWWAEILTKGKIGHGSMPFLGDSAIRHMSAVLKEIEERLLPVLLERRSSMPVVPEAAKSPSINIQSIHSGEARRVSEAMGMPTPCVPDRCTITIDRRFLIEENLESVKAEIYNLMERVKKERDNFEYEIKELFAVHPSMTEKTSKIVKVVGESITEIIGTPAEFVISPGTYDQKHIDRIGQLKNCIAYGPGILDLAHQPDEWVAIDDMVTSSQVMLLSMAKLLV